MERAPACVCDSGVGRQSLKRGVPTYGHLTSVKRAKRPSKSSVGHHYGSYLEQPVWVEEAFRSPSGEEVQVLRLHKKHGNMLVSKCLPPQVG